jgi:hypothetical protein
MEDVSDFLNNNLNLDNTDNSNDKIDDKKINNYKTFL